MAKKKIKNEIMLVTYNHDRQAILNEESWVYTDSLNIAKTIEQEHKATMRNIRKVLEEYSLKTDGAVQAPTSDIDDNAKSGFTSETEKFKLSNQKIRVVDLLMFKCKRSKGDA